jgi:multidrug efflux system outer membrane protein
MTKTILATCAAAALLSGCSLIPDYMRPDLPISSSWPTPQAEVQADTAQVADIGWKQFFADPTLQRLIAQALDHNRDLRVAALNIEVARATYRVSEADLLPNVDAGLSDTVSRMPRQLSTTMPQRAMTTRRYSANLGVTAFEADLFGRLRSLEEQALQSFLATEEARTAAQISLVAEVANAYLTLLGDRKLLTLTEDTLATREKSLHLIERSFERGIGSQLDVAQARSSVETARANRFRYLRQVELDKNALTLLLGSPLDEATVTAAGDLDAMRFVHDMAVGLPSEVLLRRPDIAGAEYSLKAANANIGAARAAFFPTISLTGSLGTASKTLGSLFEAGSGAWSFAPQLTMPIFDAGRNQANLDGAKANRDIAVARYEKAIQAAFREVADALAAKGTLTDQLQAQTALVEATQTSYRLSQARYDRGIDSYLNVLDSQRALYGAQQDLVAVQVSQLINLVTLYKSLGGGRV